MTRNGLQIGADVRAVKEAHAAITDILKSNNDRETKVAALETLRSLCLVNNTTVNHCNFDVSSRK